MHVCGQVRRCEPFAIGSINTIMSTNVITLIKVAGVTVDETTRAFRMQLRPNEHKRQDETGNSLPEFLDSLSQHIHEPTVLYFEQFVDPWSITPYHLPIVELLFRQCAPALTAEVGADFYGCFCVRPEAHLGLMVRRLLRKPRMKNAIEERRFTASVLRCIMWWSEFIELHGVDAAVILVIRPLRASWRDEEVLHSFQTAPDWLTNWGKR